MRATAVRSTASLRRYSGADLAGDAGAAQPAIAERVLGEVLLVIVLGEVEGRGIEDLGGDRPVAAAAQGCLVHAFRCLGGLALFGREHVDAGAILGAHVIPLAHALSRIVALPEGLQQ